MTMYVHSFFHFYAVLTSSCRWLCLYYAHSSFVRMLTVVLALVIGDKTLQGISKGEVLCSLTTCDTEITHLGSVFTVMTIRLTLFLLHSCTFSSEKVDNLWWISQMYDLISQISAFCELTTVSNRYVVKAPATFWVQTWPTVPSWRPISKNVRQREKFSLSALVEPQQMWVSAMTLKRLALQRLFGTCS